MQKIKKPRATWMVRLSGRSRPFLTREGEVGATALSRVGELLDTNFATSRIGDISPLIGIQVVPAGDLGDFPGVVLAPLEAHQ